MYIIYVNIICNRLQELKQELALKAEDAARLRQENMDMEQRIEELSETHE